MIIDDRPWDLLSEKEQKEKIAQQQQKWNALTKEEQKSVEDMVNRIMERKNKK